MKFYRFASMIFILIAVRIALADNHDRCWVFLREPQYSSEQLAIEINKGSGNLSERALARRAKVRSSDQLVDEFDLPLPQNLLDSIRSRGFSIVVESRMLRAVSVQGSYDQVRSLEALPFVVKVQPLPRKLPELSLESSTSPLDTRPSNSPFKNHARIQWDSADYNYSYRQLQQINLIAAHSQGYTGQGVLLGVIDAGFSRLCRSYTPEDTNSYHILFDSLHIVATHDFLNNDSLVTNHGDNGDGSHGAMTLCCIAGYLPGLYIGAAPRVSVLLAKTEQAAGADFPAEEDYWVAGLEWMERLGVDIVSSSVSWVAWLPYNVRDGQTAASSRAASLAASRGVLVVNSSGNHGWDSVPWVSCPSDADSMLCIGAVSYDSLYAGFSSRGPTYDGRIKPDLVACGVQTTTLNPNNSQTITSGTGTSFSTPIVAGACAVVLSANPALSPMQLMGIMKATASQANHPDTLFGWGVPNIAAAVDSARLLNVIPCPPGGCTPAQLPERYTIRAFPNPFNPSVVLFFAPESKTRKIQVFDITGRTIATIPVASRSSRAYFQAINLPAGNYFLRFENGQTTRISLVK